MQSTNEMIDALRVGIELFVLLQFGKLKISCSTCSDDDRVERNHDNNDISEPVYFCPYTKKEYFACPLVYIDPIIYILYDDYNFMKSCNEAKSQENTSALFWFFVKNYEYYKTKFEAMIEKEEMNKMKSRRK
jgi:hypothetical protein